VEDPRAAALNARPETRRAHTQWIWRERGSELRTQAAFVGGRQGLALAAGEEPGGVGLLWREAGDPVDHLGAEGGPREIRALPPQAEGLGRIGEREIAGQLGAGPELPGVDPAMPLGGVRVLRGEMRRAGASGCRL